MHSGNIETSSDNSRLWVVHTSGPNKGKFGTMDDITREQIAVMLYRTIPSWTLESTYRSDLSVYADQKSISPFAREGLAWANIHNIIQGKNEKIERTCEYDKLFGMSCLQVLFGVSESI